VFEVQFEAKLEATLKFKNLDVHTPILFAQDRDHQTLQPSG
jgi:hypothetical protein